MIFARARGEEGAVSGLIWKVVNEKLKPGGSISRTSVIFAMNRFVDQGILGWRDATGKGGHHKRARATSNNVLCDGPLVNGKWI